MLSQKIRNKIEELGFRGLLNAILIRFQLGKLERIVSSNWLNLFATFWLNIRSFPINIALKFPVFVYGRPRIYSLSGSIDIQGARIHPGMVKFNYNLDRVGAPSLQSVQSEFINNGQIIFTGKVKIGTGNKIYVRRGAQLTIGGDSEITDLVNIGCLKSIHIGSMVSITHRCQILDSNYHYLANFNTHRIPHCNREINIGSGSWIGNSSTISAGANLPDCTVVGSNSLVNRSTNEIPENSLIGGIPAKLIGTGFRRVYNPELISAISKYYSVGNTEDFCIMGDITLDLCSKC